MGTIFGDILEDRLVLIEKSVLKHAKKDGDLKGSAAELQIKKLIKDFSPHHTNVARGWIYNDQDEKSGERDIIVYSKNKAPEFLFDEGSGLIPNEAVLYDIQIKTTLSKKKIEDAIEKFDKPFRRHGAKALIGIDSKLNGNSLIEKYSEADPSFAINPTITILVAGNGGYFYFDTRTLPLINIISDEVMRKAIADQHKVDIKGIGSRTLIINGKNWDELKQEKLQFCYWSGNISNSFVDCMKSFLQGFSNTLFETKFGKYLNAPEAEWMKSFTCTVLDPFGNEIFQESNFKEGFNRTEFENSLQFSLKIVEDGTVSIKCTKK